ncbi:glutaminyl-peptide cyclotransferase-like [Watersipora subatra]|uniref:glutaminyl-peptide cyclotransferase-like n=1 Tax=Watersipora subatra TaxID=2589382 RepID=UPI00355BC269
MMFRLTMIRVTIFTAAVLHRSFYQAKAASSTAEGDVDSIIDFKTLREEHVMKTLTSEKYARLADLSDMDVFKAQILNPLLIERVPDTDGNLFAQEHIKYWMADRLAWHVEEDSFEEMTPYHIKNFRNIIATLKPSAKRFLNIVCHYDSKYFADFEFIGATDSAAPCAMMIDLARTLNYSLHNGQGSQAGDVSLRFLFLDGEEAFKEWTDTDSIYGARHLADKWHTTPHPYDSSSTILDGIDAFVLLDLIGARNPKFRDFFEDTTKLFKRLRSIESKLHKAGLLEDHKSENDYFQSTRYYGGIEDDHIPFLHKGVPILHLISAPFPSVWHTERDNEQALHYPTINNLNKIFRIFVSEYLHLKL